LDHPSSPTSSQEGVKWPDWGGETAVVIATGPSASEAPLKEVKGKSKVIAIKSSWRLAPWADFLYGCDRGWWIENRGVPKFKRLKATASPSVNKVYPDVRLIQLVAKAEILTGETGRIGCGLRTGGGFSGFHAINLAIQFGAKRIVLVGFDMTLAHGPHWHNDIGTHRRNDRGMAECRDAFDGCAWQFEKLGVEVINATPNSALKNYRKADLIETLCPLELEPNQSTEILS
jgi:hypothetical protein